MIYTFLLFDTEFSVNGFCLLGYYMVIWKEQRVLISLDIILTWSIFRALI